MFSKLATAMLMMLSTLIVSTGLEAASLGGTVYVGTLTDPNSGVFLSRGFYTFNKDGTVIVTNSTQQGEPTFPPFGIQQGYWDLEKCRTLKIKSFDFQYPKFITTDNFPKGFSPTTQSIAEVIANLKRTSSTTFEGTVSLAFFPLTADVNDPSQGSAPFVAANLSLQLVSKP